MSAGASSDPDDEASASGARPVGPRPSASIAKPPAASLADKLRAPPAPAPSKAREDEETRPVPLEEDAPAPPLSEPPPRLSVPIDITGAQPTPIARFGRFDIMGSLATGGMADILLARESTEGSSRHSIIKIIRGEHAENGSFAQMFLDEGRLAMRLSHPNICTVYECGHVDGRYFMAMEYVHGKTLKDVLVRSVRQKDPLPIHEVVRIFAAVAEGLDFAHRAKDAQGTPLDIVHRDVSPQNVMVRYDGVVKLLDFGVAKATKRIHESESGALKGKFAYMSPEQAEGLDVDARSDIFSLGVMLFEAITGRRLYHRKNQFATLKALLESAPPPLTTYRADAPEALQLILDRALARLPEDRYARAADMQQDLERLLAKRGKAVTTAHVAQLMSQLFGDTAMQPPELDTSSAVADRFAPVATPALAPEPTPIPASPASPKPPWLLIGAGAAALTLLGVVAGVVLGPTRGVAPPAEASSPAASVEAAPIAAREVDDAPLPEPPAEAVVSAPSPAPVDAPTTETESSPPRATTRPSERRGTRGRGTAGSASSGTVIVTDPGF